MKMASRTGITQVPFTKRPELEHCPDLLFEHQSKESVRTSGKISLLQSAISKCFDAASMIYVFEKQLFTDGIVTKENPALPSLEKSLLDLGSNKSVCEGLVYFMCWKFKDETIVRYMDCGCYTGFMKEKGCGILKNQFGLDELNLLNIYTDSDLKKRQTEGKCKIEQAYKGKLIKNRNSIQNQLALLKALFLAGEKESSLLSISVHCVRKNAKPSSTNHRYLNVYPETRENIQQWEEALKDYIVAATTPDTPQLLDLLETSQLELLSRASQFSFISLLSNDHWLPYVKFDGNMTTEKSCLLFLQHLLYQVEESTRNPDDPKPLYYPTSIRNRFLYFSLKENYRYVWQLCRFYLSQISPCVTDVEENTEES